MTGKEFKEKLKSPLIWGNLLGMVLVVVVLLLAASWWMKSYTHHGESVDVPNLQGVQAEDAIAQLEGLELEGVVIDSTYNKRLAPGIIIDQTPVAGSRVKAGRIIYLTINTTNAPTLPVPDIINNCSRREAEAKLQALGFCLGPIEYGSGPMDQVVGIKCKGRNVYAGQRIGVEDIVTLVIGNEDIETDENGMNYNEMNDSNYVGESHDESGEGGEEVF